MVHCSFQSTIAKDETVAHLGRYRPVLKIWLNKCQSRTTTLIHRSTKLCAGQRMSRNVDV